MRQTLVTLVLFTAFGFYAHAQTGSKKERIKYLFEVMQQDSLINKTFDAMTSSMAAQMSAKFKDSAYDGVSEKISKKIMEASKESARRLINEDMVDVYDKYFTPEDIENFIVFYKSESGKKMINKLPDITKDIMTIMTVKYQPEMQQALMKEINEIINDIPRQQ